MKIQVKLFARMRQTAGDDSIELELDEPATVADLKASLRGRFPELASVIDQMMVAVDTEYAGDSTPLHAGAEVACIPPVSGG